MTSSLLSCPKCRTSLEVAVVNQPGLTPCAACEAPLHVEVFPALFRRLAPGQAAEAVLVDSEASCFYHPQKKAVLPCEGCGRFLCALCDCELHCEHFCPACLEAGCKKGKIKRLENERVCYDSIALALSLLPILLFYVTFITAPISLYVAIRYWNAPRSVVHATRIRAVLAIIFANLQLIGWGLLIYFLVASPSRSHG